MTKVNAWQYLDSLVFRRRSLTIKCDLDGHYWAAVNGHFMGSGKNSKQAVMSAVRDVKRRTAAVKRHG